ncbi:hypothetical protein COCVIDRAFT_64698, partial [Bipolaris victoriae FI3]
PSTSGQESHPHKRLIVCCDGTWNSGDLEGKALTNVAKIARCISDKDDWKPKGQDGITRESRKTYIQIVHYQPGVGLGTGKVSNTWDAMTGRGLSKAIRSAYTFICLNWSSQDDQIVLIGFSRGAFTVRCVAQLIEEVGFAIGFPMAAHLPQLPRRKYCTVDDVVPRKIKFAVQALALDERRRHFKPMVWSPLEDGASQTLKQRWFTGNHSDIGGGNKDMTLANITLAWMIGQL